MDPHDRTAVSRRRLVGLLGLGAAGVAGCLDADDGAANGDEGERRGAGNGDGEPEELELFDHPGDEAVEIPDDYNCPVCNMRPNQYPNWKAQLAHEGGAGTAFDSAGCLFAYAVDPGGFGGGAAEIVGAWATDFQTRETIDSERGAFVLKHDPDRVDDPMELNPAPFAERDAALAYVDEYDDLSAADVVGFDAVGRDEAELYRGKRLP